MLIYQQILKASMDYYVWLPFRRISLPRCYHNKRQIWCASIQDCVRIGDNQKTPFLNGLVFFHVFCLGETRSGNSAQIEIKTCVSCLELSRRYCVEMLRNVLTNHLLTSKI